MLRKTTFTPLRRALLGMAVLGLSASAAQAQTVYGLSITSSPAVSSLVTFDAGTPGTFTSTVLLSGYTAGQAIVGIDSRPNTGQVFALGYNPTGTVVQLYVINLTTGVLTPVGAALTQNLGASTSRIGFDFNPTVDRIRVTAANGTDLRLNPNNGGLAATDGTLAYATTDANTGQTPGVGSSAYTNSYIGSTATMLYNLDEANSRLVLQNPPNNGTLLTVGPLGVATNGVSQSSDLDIYSSPAGVNTAYMTSAISTSAAAAASTLYTVNLATGAATVVGALGTGPLVAITDITFAISRPATLPAVTGQLAYALAGTNLLTFDTSKPDLVRTSVGITGVDATQTLAGIDIRPATNTLYAFGYNTTAQTYTLYALNTLTGVASPVNTTPIALALGTGKVGFDFNPVVDRIRVTSGSRANFRLNPNDGALAATDTNLAYATGDANAAATPNIGASAYTNSVANATATTTALYNYDLSLNILAVQAAPNTGALATVGATGITANTVTSNLDLDIYSSVAGTNIAYLVANPGTSPNTNLYTVNLATGATTLVGAIGNGLAARDIAIAGNAGVVTAVRERADLATGFGLYPNPSHDGTTLAFELVRAAQVELSVFDHLGRRVATQRVGMLPAGRQAVRWQSADARAGLYLVRLSVDGQAAATQRLVLE